MVNLSVGRSAVTIKLHGAEKFLAIKSKIIIPLENIKKVSTEHVKPIWFPEMRLGSHLPGVFMAGTFWLRKGGKTFYYAKDFSNCITLILKNHDYAKIIVEVDGNKNEIATGIKNAIC
jgi:hypothetical protein